LPALKMPLIPLRICFSLYCFLHGINEDFSSSGTWTE
jgi:hypothetical protein